MSKSIIKGGGGSITGSGMTNTTNYINIKLILEHVSVVVNDSDNTYSITLCVLLFLFFSIC